MKLFKIIDNLMKIASIVDSLKITYFYHLQLKANSLKMSSSIFVLFSTILIMASYPF